MNRRRTVSSGVSSSPASSLKSAPDTSSIGGQSVDSERDRGAMGGSGAGELDVRGISDLAREQLADILGTVEGKKDIVIQPQLISLLEHITPFKFLKE